jgi:uncharacterized protein YbbK (DUF523 family)
VRKILVSRCLYGGAPVRYDGGEAPCLNPVFLKWKEEGRLVPVCPEVCGGLPVPRPESQRAAGVVMTVDGRDVTAGFEAGAREALRIAKESDAVFAILKDGSPSCGVHRIHDGSFKGIKIPGKGVTAELLESNGCKVFSENEIPEAAAALTD